MATTTGDAVTSRTSEAATRFPRGPRRVVGFAWFTLGFLVFTIAGGALVRATHSGDGCGQSWPTCDGQVVPGAFEDSAQLIEFTHRGVSGVSLLLVAALLVVVLRAFPRPHPARTAAGVTAVLIVVEALIGAAIVLYGWVADDMSVARQISVPLHLVNTFALTAAMTLTVWLVSGGRMPRFDLDRRTTYALAGLGTLMLLVAATGATTSLADTVFTETAVESGADLSDETALIVRLRIIHPIVAIGTGALLAWFVVRRVEEAERRGSIWPARIILGVVVMQMGLGFIHIALLTPVATALLHLTLAQVLWITFVLFALALLAPPGNEHAAVERELPLPLPRG